jgi:uncharacterized protein DUF6798
MPTPTEARVGRTKPTTRRLIVFSLLAALLATFLTDYRYAEVGIEEIDPMIRRAMDPDYLTNDFFTNVTDEFGPRFYSTRLIAAVATPGSLPVVYFSLTLFINCAIALLTGLFAKELFHSNLAGLFTTALVMGASSFQLGGAGQAHANEPNSYWMSFSFAIAAVWAATRARPILTGVMAGLVSLLHPSFGAAVGGLVFTAVIVALWARRRREGTRIPLVGVGVGLLLFGAFLAGVAIPYSGGARIPEEQFFNIMTLRAPHHLLPSTFDIADWLEGLLFMVALVAAWRWVRQKNLPDRFAATVLASLTAGLLLFFVGGFLFVEVWPWKPWFIAVPYRSTSYFLWLGLLVIGGCAARKAIDSASPGDGMFLQGSCFNPISCGLAHLAVLVKEKLHVTRPIAVAGVVVAIASGIALTDPRDLVQFLIVNGLAAWFFVGPDRVWASVLGVCSPLVLAGGLLAFQTMVHTPGAIDRIGPEVLPSQVEGSEANIARAAGALTPVDSVILTPPTFGTFRVLSERAIVVDMRDIPYQEDGMAEWMDRIANLYGIPDPAGLESEDFGGNTNDLLDATYRVIDDKTIRAICRRYRITHAVLFAETRTAYPLLDQNDAYKLVEIDDCG